MKKLLIEPGATYYIKGDSGSGAAIAASQDNRVRVSGSGTNPATEQFTAHQNKISEDSFALESESQQKYLTNVPPNNYAETAATNPLYLTMRPVKNESDVYTIMWADDDEELFLTMQDGVADAQITFTSLKDGKASPKQKWKFLKSITDR